MKVIIAHSPGPREVLESVLQLPEASTVADAVQAAGLSKVASSVGIWSRKCAMDTSLRDGDRIEVYRGLRVDPKVARRERFAKQGSKAAGLFSRRRQGGKPGY